MKKNNFDRKKKLILFLVVLAMLILACNGSGLDPNNPLVKIITYIQMQIWNGVLNLLNIGFGANSIPPPQIISPDSPVDLTESIILDIEGKGPSQEDFSGDEVPIIQLYTIKFRGCDEVYEEDELIGSVPMAEGSKDWKIEGVSLQVGDIISAKVQIGEKEGPFGNLVFIGTEYFTPLFDESLEDKTDEWIKNIKVKGLESGCYQLFVNGENAGPPKWVTPPIVEEPIWQFEKVALNNGENILETRLFYADYLSSTKSIQVTKIQIVWPLGKMINGVYDPDESIGTITGWYGKNDYYAGKIHHGLDIAGDPTTEIHAVAAGMIYKDEIDNDPYLECKNKEGTSEKRLKCEDGEYITDGWEGRSIIIHHGDWTSTYMHLSEISQDFRQNPQEDKDGRKFYDIEQNEVIGKMGSTGNSDGDHLHLELHGTTSSININPYHLYDSTLADHEKTFELLLSENKQVEFYSCASSNNLWEGVDWSDVNVRTYDSPSGTEFENFKKYRCTELSCECE